METYSCHVFNQLYDDLCYLRRSGAFHPPVALPSADVAEHDRKGVNMRIKENCHLPQTEYMQICFRILS